MEQVVKVTDNYLLPKISTGNHKISEILPYCKKIELENKNAAIYLLTDGNNHLYGVKRVKTKNKEYKKEYCNTDIGVTELYFFKALEHSNVSVFPKITSYEFYNNQLYIMSPWIQGITFKDFLESSPSEADLQSMFFQIVYSIELLNTHYGIIHNDLHLNNILLRIEDKGFDYNKVSLDGHDYYTKNTGYSPVLWDFGFSFEKTGTKDRVYYYKMDVMKGIDHYNEEEKIDYLKFLSGVEFTNRNYSVFLFYTIKKLFSSNFRDTFAYLKKFQLNNK